MRVLVFDPFRGAAGDMICGALLDLGADADLVSRAMRSVVAEPVIAEVKRGGIRAIRVDTQAPVVSRSLSDVHALVQKADAPGEAIAMACRVFDRIAAGEAAIHGARSHFHEVGADDAIAEVIGACTALHSLSVDQVAVRTIALGGGTTRSTHGTLPVPAPATLAILEDSGLAVRYGSDEDGELCTPTGAALLSEFATFPCGGPPRGTLAAIGYGAGERDPPAVPNVLRVTLLETGAETHGDEVDVLETNVDDVTGEILAGCMDSLMAMGARDVCALPCTMKKGRPGYLVRVICYPDDSARLALALARETGTLGVRCLPSVHRFVAERQTRVVRVNLCGQEWEIPVKCGILEGEIYSLKAEFDRTREVAKACGIPARDVARLAEDKARRATERKDA
ncbi:MAG: hypothetical protein A4E40_00805 [Methanoregulaceae archaeon PtaU1.Bin059]|nr:MAG: hypothetical protein A4E39_00259 [Methanoregulaceae archaeon PtaB.Bin152]OPY40555.1 MAG: hypothetical protein A4E40_00805 [Methanoregulaceae archaeon PtaU1.Bin059]